MAMKTESDGQHPASHYLVVEDASKPSSWHLRVKDAKGNVDHGLLGAAWAALHSGYRGSKYSGPNADEALKKLIALYKSEKMDTPSSKSAEDDDEQFKDAPYDETEWKTVPVTMDFADLEPNEFKAYPAITGTVDRGGDLIPRGAFTSVLADAREHAKVYAEHGVKDGKLPIGRPLEVTEDSTGLFVKGRVSETTEGTNVLTLLRDKVIDRMSIGYRPKRVRYLTHQEGKSIFGEAEYKSILDRLPVNHPRVRVLEEFKSLFDFSFVANPMNLDAKLLGVKSALHAGVTLDDHFSEVHAANEELLERFQDLFEMRFKAGRMLSGVNVSKLQSMRDDHAALLQRLDNLIDAALPAEADAKSIDAEAERQAETLRQILRFEAMRARELGVLLT